MQHAGAVLVQQGGVYLVADVDGGREKVLGPEADAALFLGKFAPHTQAVHPKPALVTLQLHLLGAVEHEALQAPQIGELVVAKHPAAGHEALVAGVEKPVGHVVAQHGVVGVKTAVQAEFLAVDAGKHAATVSVFFADVGVGNLLHRVVEGPPHRLNRARGVAHKGREVQVGPFHQGAVAQLVVVGVFGAQRGVAFRHNERVGGLDVGVQKLQGRALNAAVVGHFQHVAVGKLAREVHARHQHAVVGDGHRLAVPEIGHDGGVLVAQARLEGEALGQAQGVGHVGGGHVLAVVKAVVQARAHQGPKLAVLALGAEVAVVAVHAAQNVLGSELQQLGFAGWRLVVGLHRKFLVGAGVFVAQPAGRAKVLKVEDVVGEVVRAVVAAVQGQEAEFLLRLLEHVGVVQAGVHRAREVGHAHVAHRVAVRQRRNRSQPVLVGARVAGPVGERGREGVVLVQVVVPAQHRAAKRLVLPRIGCLPGGRDQGPTAIFDALLVAELAGNVVARPSEAAQRKAHFAGAQAALQAQVAAAGAHAGVDAQGAAAQVVGFGDDVDDAPAALGVVLRRGRGDDFHGLNLVGRNLLQCVGNAAGRDGRGLVVDEHPDVGAAAQGHVAVQVHAQQGHAFEHVGGVAAAGGLVVFGVVHGAVHLLFNQRFLARHHHLVQLLGRSRQRGCAQGHGAARGHQHAGALLGFVAQKAELHRVGAGGQAGQHKLAIVAAHAPVHYLARGPVKHRHRGVRNWFAGGRVRHRTGNAAGGGAGRGGGRALLGRNQGRGAQQGSQQAGRSQ